jgi:hypothetical protein
MKFEIDNVHRIAEITLSRRNLLALLGKLDGHPEGSGKTIAREAENGWRLVIIAEENPQHYGDRPAGAMEAATERYIRKRAPGDKTVTA